ncbi:carbamoyltransferase HypF [Desulfovibrio sp. OttesenSCG-928-G15]|nr:carbamoyltransferase HypF [Desulfovibrio sp. OttesenSCG-928-G15]
MTAGSTPSFSQNAAGMHLQRTRFVVQGQVQGVGFRPFVFTLADELGLTGFVRNSPRGVVIEVQGDADKIARFALSLEQRLPPLARITSLQREALDPLPTTDRTEHGFSIAASTASGTHAVLISPDMATCPDCLADMTEGRRKDYPFTNCTNCGPRYTITRSIPYDRPHTSMGCFPLCPECRAEYENPRNRRFHAQPNACPECGPHVWFALTQNLREADAALADAQTPASSGASLPPYSAAPGNAHTGTSHDKALDALTAFLAGGGIAAVKGLGGFHLACDACNDAAVALLRQRKKRPHKPFAVMVRNCDEAEKIALVSDEARALLASQERPIVLCPLRSRNGHALARGISPDTRTIGIMLPYTPLHHILLERFGQKIAARCEDEAQSPKPCALVMTSGNPAGEPICLGNREALAKLGHLADAFLFHDRDILIRVDDSVLRPLPGRGTLFFRRARGFVPRPICLAPPQGEARPAPGGEPAQTAPCVLGVGAELKNSLCLTKGDNAFVSQFIGDMANLETAAFHEAMRGHLADLLKVSPQLVVRDKHPDYLSSSMAQSFAAEQNLPVLPLQHHEAHAMAVLAENRHNGKALVFALDGTGLGHDGTLWGGELILVDTGGSDTPPDFTRLCSFAPMDLPGGEAAIKEPWRIAHALLLRLCLAEEDLCALWPEQFRQTATAVATMLRRRINSPVSTSCGRLFDAASALLGLCHTTSYEGQAAIRLEEAAQGQTVEEKDYYPCPLRLPASGQARLDTHSLFAALFEDRQSGTATNILAARFHASLAFALTQAASFYARKYTLTHVGLSGGCMQNTTLTLLLADMLEARGLVPLLHRELPPGDGCISFGQAVWGRNILLAQEKMRQQP